MGYNAGFNLNKNPRFNKNLTVKDDFSTSNNEWEKLASYVTSTKSLVNGKLKLTGVDVKKGCWVNRNSIGRNIMMAVDMVGGTRDSGTYWARARAHLREVSEGNYCAVHIGTDGILYVSKVISNVGNNIKILAIPNYAHTTDYRAIIRGYENFWGIDLIQNGRVIVGVEAVDSYFDTSNSTLNGLTSGDIPLYDNFQCQRLDGLVNVIFVGDSNTLQSSVTAGYRTVDILKTYFKDYPVAVWNRGVSGDHIENVSTRISTDITANKVNKAKNICIVMVGANDIANGDSAATAWSQLDSLYDSILATGFELWAVTLPPRTDNSTYNATAKDVNKSIRQSTKPKVIIDLYSDLVDPANDNAVLSGMLKADGIHLDTNGCAIWANKIKTELLNVYPNLHAGNARVETLNITNIKSNSSHPTNYKPVYIDTDTKELYIYTGA